MNKMHTLSEAKHPLYDGPDSMLPSFSLNAKQLPEIKKWQVGKKYTLVMEVEQVSASKDEYGDSVMNARFKIHKVGEKEMLSESEKEARKGHY